MATDRLQSKRIFQAWPTPRCEDIRMIHRQFLQQLEAPNRVCEYESTSPSRSLKLTCVGTAGSRLLHQRVMAIKQLGRGFVRRMRSTVVQEGELRRHVLEWADAIKMAVIVIGERP